MAAVMGSSPPSSSVGADSPRSCASAAELSSSPDPMAGYRIAAAAAAARAMSTGGFTGAWGSSEGASGSMFGRPAVASSGNSSSSARSPVVAALCGLSRAPWSPGCSQPGAAAAAAALLARPHGKLRAQVVSAEMLSLDSKDCIVYKVRVADNRGEWTVTRRWALMFWAAQPPWTACGALQLAAIAAPRCSGNIWLTDASIQHA